MLFEELVCCLVGGVGESRVYWGNSGGKEGYWFLGEEEEQRSEHSTTEDENVGFIFLFFLLVKTTAIF